MPYYFEVLPIHIKPENAESLSSYLMRLAEANGISSVDGISALCFPNQNRRITREIADYPPKSLSSLAAIGVCSKETLQMTTFFHLAIKFGRSTLPQPISRFLSGCIYPYLRYCPLCLKEQQVKYYPLIWRFQLLNCCCEHKYRLLETCGRCNTSIPLLASPFKVGQCPKCGQCLELCTAVRVPAKTDLEAAMYVHDDLIFLLMPQQWEMGSSHIIKRIGRRFAHIRQVNQLTASEVADQTGSTLTAIEGIERGNTQSRGASFQNYFKYAYYLHLTFKEVFSNTTSSFS